MSGVCSSTFKSTLPSANGSFSGDYSVDEDIIKKAFERQKKWNNPSVLIVFSCGGEYGEKYIDKITHALNIIEMGKGGTLVHYYIIADASNISWFAYNR
jgi:hypothetical protein